MPASCSRRVLLALMAAGTAGLLAGCSEDSAVPQSAARPSPTDAVEPADGPRPTPAPAIPDATDVSDAADRPALLAALLTSRDLRDRAALIRGVRGPQARVLEECSGALTQQVDALTRLLQAGGITVPPDPAAAPAERPDDAATTSGTSAGTSTERSRLLDELASAAALAVAPQMLDQLSEVSRVNLAMLTSVAAQRAAMAGALGRPVRWEPLAGPTGEAAAVLLGAVRPAGYGFQVLAARSRGDERAAYEATLTMLKALTRELTQLAGDAAPPAPLGYVLPDPLDTRHRRARLATALFAVLPPTVVAGAHAYTGDRASVAGTVRLLAEVVVAGRPWGLSIEGFAGMTVP